MENKSTHIYLILIIGLLAAILFIQIQSIPNAPLGITTTEYQTKWMPVDQQDLVNNRMAAEGWEIVTLIRAGNGQEGGRSITYKRRK